MASIDSETMESSSSQPSVVLYKSFSICPICAFVTQKKFEWIDAQVVERGKDVWLTRKCPIHGVQDLYYCSNSDFFKRMLKYLPGVLENQKGSVFNLDELKKRVSFQCPEIYNQPLIMDMTLWDAPKKRFFPDDELLQVLGKITQIYPRDKNFIIRLGANLTDDINALNARVKFVCNQTPNPVLLDLTFERLLALARMKDSILLDSRVHPSVRTYLSRGNETKDTLELEQLFLDMRKIRNLHVVVTLVIRRPFPDLTELIRTLRANAGLVRYIVLHLERGPEYIMDSMKKSTQGSKDNSHNLDPYELIRLIEKCTKGEISESDFFPASIGAVLEPFVSMLGMGNYFIRPSPFDAFGTVLVNTEQHRSVPLTRFFDLDKMFSEMVPLLRSMQQQSAGSTQVTGIFDAMKLKKIVKSTVLKSAANQLPKDLFSYVTDKSKAETTRNTINNAQVLVIHNNYDVAAADLVRRARCSVCTFSNACIFPTGIAASSTLCI